jgi:hypothetical protein
MSPNYCPAAEIRSRLILNVTARETLTETP